MQDMILELKRAFSSKVKRIKFDNGGEFVSTVFQDWLKERGIVPCYTTPYSPESNGKAKRLNRPLNDMTRSMMTWLPNSAWKKKMWAKAVCTASHIRNRVYTSAQHINPTAHPDSTDSASNPMRDDRATAKAPTARLSSKPVAKLDDAAAACRGESLGESPTKKVKRTDERAPGSGVAIVPS